MDCQHSQRDSTSTNINTNISTNTNNNNNKNNNSNNSYYRLIMTTSTAHHIVH
jgi:hypothetical protein